MDFDGKYQAPAEIERRSMELISEELGARAEKFPPEELTVLKRVIHATADFDYAENLQFTAGAAASAVAALRSGASIVTDTAMAMAGINKRVLLLLGGKVYNFMGDPDVAREARARGVTRAAVSMERAGRMNLPMIYAIGNAPTALLHLCELIEAGKLQRPLLVIGVPVGFVNVVEAKEQLLREDVPSIVARGRKGGSGVAAAVCNALLYLASYDRRE